MLMVSTISYRLTMLLGNAVGFYFTIYTPNENYNTENVSFCLS